MGDSFQTLALVDVSHNRAESVAQSLRRWLIAEGMILEETGPDCTLSESPGHRPGPTAAGAFGGFDDPQLAELQTNGVSFEVGREAFGPTNGEVTCPDCGSTFDTDDEYMAAVGAWYEGDDDAVAACPDCEYEQSVTRWTGPTPWAFANLGITFWNWPPLSKHFIRAVGDRSQSRVKIVADRR